MSDNNYDKVVKVQQYDNNVKIFFNIFNDGIVEPINGSTVTLKFMDFTTKVKMQKECVITDAELAECLYVLTSDDLSVPGTYNTEIQIEYQNGTILSQDDTFILIVTPEVISRK